MLQLLVRSPELHVESHRHGAEDSYTAQRNYREAAALQRRIDVGLKVEVVLIILIHPDPKIRDNKRLHNQKDLHRTRNMPSRSLDMIARAHSPGDWKISASLPDRLPIRFDKGGLCPWDWMDSIHVQTLVSLGASFYSGWSSSSLLCWAVPRLTLDVPAIEALCLGTVATATASFSLLADETCGFLTVLFVDARLGDSSPSLDPSLCLMLLMVK